MALSIDSTTVTSTTGQRGFVAPESLAALILLAAAAIVAFGEFRARATERGESRAIAFIGDLAAVQRERLMRGGSSAAATTLDELISGGDGIDARLHAGGVLVRDGYCFIAYLATTGGEPVSARASATPNLVPGFFLLYAWPVTPGRGGRRVFVADAEIGLRAWDHGRELVVGPERPPAAWLASPREGRSYPFARRAGGWQRSIPWIEVES